MKKFVSLLIIALFVLNSGGYMFAYLFLQNKYKQEGIEKISSSLSSNNLIRIEIELSNLNDSRYVHFINEREIIYKGKIYDIFQSNVENTKLILLCEYDIKENNLYKAFFDYNNNLDSPQKHVSLKDILNSLIKSGLLSNFYTVERHCSRKNFDPYYSEIYFSPVYEIPTPPPLCIA